MNRIKRLNASAMWQVQRNDNGHYVCKAISELSGRFLSSIMRQGVIRFSLILLSPLRYMPCQRGQRFNGISIE